MCLMCKKRNGLLRMFTALFVSVWLIMGVFPAVFADEKQITVTFSVREYITNSYYFEDVSIRLPENAVLMNLLEACESSGLIAGYSFEGETLNTLLFPDGTALRAGDYGRFSGFEVVSESRRLDAHQSLRLRDNRRYVLSYKVHPNDRTARISKTDRTPVRRWEWNDSFEATLDSACGYLYQYRSRGSLDAVTALGVARHAANPVDVVLLTQMSDVRTDSLDELLNLLYAVTYCGYSHPTVDGTDLFMKLQSFQDARMCTTAQLCGVLQLYDGYGFTVSDDMPLSRRTIISALLSRINQDGGFSSNGQTNSSVLLTAKAITVLQPYRDLEIIDTAVLGGISYLSSPEVRDRMFAADEDCAEVAAMLVAMCSCQLPIHDVYFTKDGMTYADLLLRYMCVSGGFSNRIDGAAEDRSTAGAVIALRALRQMDNPYITDMNLVPLTVDPVVLPPKPSQEMPAPSPKTPVHVKSGFGLMFGCITTLILFELARYIFYRKRLKMTKQTTEDDRENHLR